LVEEEGTLLLLNQLKLNCVNESMEMTMSLHNSQEKTHLTPAPSLEMERQKEIA
jgi:hypothetical protein